MEHTIIRISKSDNQEDKWSANITYLDENLKPECGFEGHMNVEDLVKTIDDTINKGYFVEIQCHR